MIDDGAYRERPAGVRGVILWSADGRSEPARILPDGCMDLVWSGTGLVVAGPDTAARQYIDPLGRRHAGLRFAGGLGPRLLGVPADAVRDRTVALADVWGERRAAALTSRMADPERALAAWLADQEADAEPFGSRVAAGLGGGMSVAAVADRVGITARTLHRRCLPVFGYGPQHLARVLRLRRALDAARAGRAWGDVAASTGYADQQHLAREVRSLVGTTPSRLLAEHS